MHPGKGGLGHNVHGQHLVHAMYGCPMNQPQTGLTAAGSQSRRERYREETFAEIRSHALAQVMEGGESAVSLNAIARQMGMSPSALYRYYDSRESLVVELIADIYDELSDHLLGSSVGKKLPSERLRALARGYREWALRNPNKYRLIFETSASSAAGLSSERVVAASQRSMGLFQEVLSEVGVSDSVGISTSLDEQLREWGRRAHSVELPATVLVTALTVWTRLHGFASLEIGQHLKATGVDPSLLFEVELDRLTAMTVK